MQSAEAIKENIEAMLCPKHDIYASVNITGNEIQIICCCAFFHEICTGKAKEMLQGNDFIGGLIFE